MTDPKDSWIFEAKLKNFYVDFGGKPINFRRVLEVNLGFRGALAPKRHVLESAHVLLMWHFGGLGWVVALLYVEVGKVKSKYDPMKPEMLRL